MNESEANNGSEASQDVAPRILPGLDQVNRPFWTSGERGVLSILWCETCGRFVHPPSAQCPEGHSGLEAKPVSGEGTIFTFTVNHHSFHPAVPTPYVIAIVELVEQQDLRIIANIVRCPVESVSIGMPVRVAFEAHGEIYAPVFEPA